MELTYHLRQVFLQYWNLGFISFGGPGVHVIILRRKFVDQLKWIDSTTYLDLFTLGNALPGPGSTQLAFSIAVVCHGVLAGLLAFFLWSLPGAIGMAGLGIGVARIPDSLPAIVLALLSGFNAAAVGLIALAAVQLAHNAATDRITLLILWLTASFGICYHAPWMYPTLIAASGITTLAWDFRRVWLFRPIERLRNRTIPQVAGAVELEEISETPIRPESRPAPLEEARPVTPPSARADALKVVPYRVALSLLVGFALLLAVPLGARAGLLGANKPVPRSLDFFCNMVIAGTIIFGGGPVVIPLLRDYVVVEGWVSSRDFLLIFAILQAFPGPNFNFAAALGVLAITDNRGLGAVLGYLGIFAPGILLKLALLPFYSSWRDKSLARAVLRGLNAGASGLVFTAVWQLFLVGYIYQPATGGTGEQQTVSGPLTSDPFWAVVASGSFLASRSYGIPPAFSIIGGGLAGLAWYGVRNA